MPNPIQVAKAGLTGLKGLIGMLPRVGRTAPTSTIGGIGTRGAVQLRLGDEAARIAEERAMQSLLSARNSGLLSDSEVAADAALAGAMARTGWSPLISAAPRISEPIADVNKLTPGQLPLKFPKPPSWLEKIGAEIEQAGSGREAGLALRKARQQAKKADGTNPFQIARALFSAQPKSVKALEILGPVGFGAAKLLGGGESTPAAPTLSVSDIFGTSEAQPQMQQTGQVPTLDYLTQLMQGKVGTGATIGQRVQSLPVSQAAQQQSAESILDNLIDVYGLNKKEAAQLKADWWAKQLGTMADVQAQQALDAQKYEEARYANTLNAIQNGVYNTELQQYNNFIQDPVQAQQLRAMGINTFVDYVNALS